MSNIQFSPQTIERVRMAIINALPEWEDDPEQADGRVCSEITYGDVRRLNAALELLAAGAPCETR